MDPSTFHPLVSAIPPPSPSLSLSLTLPPFHGKQWIKRKTGADTTYSSSHGSYSPVFRGPVRLLAYEI